MREDIVVYKTHALMKCNLTVNDGIIKKKDGGEFESCLWWVSEDGNNFES